MHGSPIQRISLVLLLSAAAVPAVAIAKAVQTLFQEVQTHKDELSRYGYLIGAVPALSNTDRGIALQLLASTENELGLYSEAIRDFPLRSRPPAELVLPTPADWQALDAVDAIVDLASKRQIVMVNEAHHDGHKRLLTLALLPRLRSLGFKYFAAEAFIESDADLKKRGYPLKSSGSEYLHDPLYGDIVREAMRLGFVMVPYEAAHTDQRHEREQAQNLYKEIFSHDPSARVFIHAGYAHIDKSLGRLGSIRPMAMELQSLTHIEPLSIDQTDILEDTPTNEIDAAKRAEADSATARSLSTWHATSEQLLGATAKPLENLYQDMVAIWRPAMPVVFRHLGDGKYWSARPDAYDLSVILPPGNFRSSNYAQGAVSVRIDGHNYAVMPPAAGGSRPTWLTLGGARSTVSIDSNSCKGSLPCLAEAILVGESSDAIASDRYLFIQDGQTNVLYLRLGQYRVRYVGMDGHVLEEERLAVPLGEPEHASPRGN